MDSKNQNIKKSVLGRGLAALIEDAPESSPVGTLIQPSMPSGIQEIQLEYIEVNTFQPRDHFDEVALQELSDSIKVQGIIQPITVRKLSTNQYQIISGERRFRASKMAGLTKIPAYIREANDQQMLEMALIENIQRENLNPIEVALSYQRLISECKLKQEELGDRVGKNRVSVTNYLRLLKLPPDIQVAVRDQKLSFGHARAIIGLEQVDLQLLAYKKILQENLSVRNTEELVRQLQEKGKNKTEKFSPASVNPEIKKLQGKLSSHFGTRVSLKADQKNGGEIKIPFYSAEDLSRILEI
jgi:ParB family chromosome partitioning protein